MIIIIQDTKCQPTALVYTDVLFQQKEFHVSSFDPNDKIEYAQVKGGEFLIQPTASLQTRSTAAGMWVNIVYDFNIEYIFLVLWYADHEINLENLLIQIKSAILDSDRLYRFGKALGTTKELLDRYTRLQPVDEGLVEILNEWLRNHSGQSSWKEITEALTEVGLQQFALDIKSVHQTGVKQETNTIEGIAVRAYRHPLGKYSDLRSIFF